MKKIHCSAINQKIHRDTKAFIHRNELYYKTQIETIAGSIAESRGAKPIILLAGPSGSGKTTTALRLEQFLDMNGMETHTISMDNYFLPLDEKTAERNEDGTINFESPSRLDIALLNEHMKLLSEGEEVEIPAFDFTRQDRAPHGRKLRRKPNELIIFEGIHALNPEVTGDNEDIANCVYVSVRTRLEANDGRILHPSHIRLMRRIIRDKLFRARSCESTISMFRSVERGENEYIMPFKKRSQYSIDTFMYYEPSVYREYLLDDLRAARGKISTDEFDGLDLMIEVLEELESVNTDCVPGTSLVREFVGGSELEY